MVNESANNAEEPGSSSPAEVILSQNPTQLLTASLSTGLCWLTATNGSNASRRGHEAEVLVDDLVPLLPTGRCTESHLIFATSLRTATKPPRASQPRVPRDLPLLTFLPPAAGMTLEGSRVRISNGRWTWSPSAPSIP